MIVFLILYFWGSNLYSKFLIIAFGFCYQFCTFKNPIFSANFYLGVWLLAWLLSPLLTLLSLPRSPLSHPSPFSSLLNSVNLFGCPRLWRALRELMARSLSPFDSPSSLGDLYLLPPSFLLYVTLWTSLRVPDCGEHKGNWLLARLLSLLLISPLPPPGHFYLPLPSSLLHVTLWTSLGVPHCGESFHH